jgi:hypothetical protein
MLHKLRQTMASAFGLISQRIKLIALTTKPAVKQAAQVCPSGCLQELKSSGAANTRKLRSFPHDSGLHSTLMQLLFQH